MQTTSWAPFVFAFSGVWLEENTNEGRENWARDRRRRTKAIESTDWNTDHSYAIKSKNAVIKIVPSPQPRSKF